MAELKVRKKEDLTNCEQPFDDSNNYNKALRFADEKLAQGLKNCILHINERNESARLEGIYTTAAAALNSAVSQADYEKAAQIFDTVKSYRDSAELAKKCRENSEICRKNDIYNTAKKMMNEKSESSLSAAIELFSEISGWRDSDEQIDVCKKGIEELKLNQEKERINAAKRRKKIIAITTPVVCVCIVFVIVFITVIIPTRNYNKAISLLTNGEIIDAYESLVALNGYKDSAAKADEIFVRYTTEKLKIAEVGDIIFFGTYEQDNNSDNGKEDIEWLVLTKENNKLLLISKYGLERMPFNNTRSEFNWETSTIKKWLNTDFLLNSFSTEQQNNILKVFLLNESEVKQYFSTDDDRKCKPTEYCNQKEGFNSWWVNSVGSWETSAVDVSGDGKINDGNLPDRNGNYIDNDNAMVRPAMWIDISKMK